MINKFIDAFPGPDSSIRKKLDTLLDELESIPDSFCGLVWLHDHDWLWMSKGIENVLGHAQQKLLNNHGLLYFQSLTPPHWVDHIYQSLRDHLSKINAHPLHIEAPLLAQVEAGLMHADGSEIPISHTSAFIDYRPGQHDSYLILGNWLDMRSKSSEQVNKRRENIECVLLAIKEMYFKLFPERLELCKVRQKITDREREIARLLAAGLSTKAISTRLRISFYTVETHRKKLLEKFGARNTAELINKARDVFKLE